MRQGFLLFGFCLGFIAQTSYALPTHNSPLQKADAATKRWLTQPYPILPFLDAKLPKIATRPRSKSADWPMPTRQIWTIVDGRPIVGTPQMDVLYTKVDHKRATSLRWLLTRYKIKEKTLRALNPAMDFNNIEFGQNLLMWRREEGAISQSVGRASRGRLLNGEPLPDGSHYVTLFAHRAFGTYYAVSEIQRAMSAYAESYPKASPLIIGDLSYKTGRRLKPHVSHQSGRDVDVTYPRHDATPNYKRFHYIRRRSVNLQETLFLIKRFAESGMTEFMLIDRPIQRRLYKYAKRQGAPQAWLDAVFQYPRYAGGRAFVRNARGHDDHFHVRFYCQPTDYRCK